MMDHEVDALTESSTGKLVRLLAMQLVDGRPRVDQIQMLTRAGLTSPEIGRILGINASTVRSTLSQTKARSPRARKSGEQSTEA